MEISLKQEGIQMANVIIPITARNAEEFKTAVRLKRTAILIDNDEIEAAVKKSVKKSTGVFAASGFSNAAGALGVVAFATIPVLGAAVLLSSLAATAVGTAVGGGQFLADGLCKYTVIRDELTGKLVLIRILGVNAIKKGDTIQGTGFQYTKENLKKQEKAAKQTTGGV